MLDIMLGTFYCPAVIESDKGEGKTVLKKSPLEIWKL